ncbi:hypothetical protein F5Y04DRAFT_289847 [Hypomontagnella monticulosa]|nr:hypothetical protein F5Y04DRAFT_289847 [Hypomontagnella monticulosa]
MVNFPRQGRVSRLGHGSQTQEPTNDPHKLSDMNMGDEAEKVMAFCPWKLIQTYPHRYTSGQDQGAVAEFFKSAIFENRTWDFFYLLYIGEADNRDPLLLVPTTQFKAFLDDANSQLGTRLDIPRGQASEKFLLLFGEFNTPLPRFLGCPHDDKALDELKIQINGLPEYDLTCLSAAALKYYKDRMDKIYASYKSQKKNPEIARQKRIQRQKGFGRMVKRAQRYLGLRQVPERSISTALSGGWQVDAALPFKVGSSVRFVCVDIEAWEKAHNVLTEVGVAILDTKDIMNVPPGEDGHGWFHYIKSYHLRIREHSNKVNHMYLRGCPESFDFGNSEFIYERDLKKVLGSVIGNNESRDRRPVIMVGHDLKGDLKYLQRGGYNVWRLPYFSDEIDTQAMFQRWERSSNSRSLAYVCEKLGTPGRNFHNAGNDATWTLRAMVMMTVQQQTKGYEPLPKESEDDKPESREEEWSDGTADDGGLPQTSAEPELPFVSRPATHADPTRRDSPW